MQAGVIAGCAMILAAAAFPARGAPPVSREEVEKRLDGTWIGVSGEWGKEGPPPAARSFTFATNHQCKVTIGKETFTGTYRISVSNEPFQVDFTFEVQGRKITTLTIFEFSKEGRLRIAEWDPDWRRKEFAPGITFQKK